MSQPTRTSHTVGPMKNDKLKKNIFWILAGVGPFLTLLAFIFIVFIVGGAIDERATAIDGEFKTLTGKSAKGTLAMETMEKQKETIALQKQKLWEANWQVQLKLFKWPNNPDMKVFEEKYQKFGEKMIVSNDELNTFKRRDVYEAAYETSAEVVAPTTFLGGNWRNVLRYVSNWGERTPTQNQIWLALEDLWVQRGLLEPIRTVNDDFAMLLPMDDGKTPLKRTFGNRIWLLELEVVDGGKAIKSKLTNRTDRMQLLGGGKTMRLKILLSDNAPPIDYRIEEEFLKANETLDVRLVPRLHGIPPGTDVKKIIAVKQVLDQRTVPIRRIDAMALGKVDARHIAAVLKPPKFLPPPEVAVAAATGPPEGMGLPPGAELDPDRRGLGAGGATGAGAGDPTSTLDAKKDRYIEATDQVRRMPVALILVVDQSHLQDTLVAFANCSLRFQVTQYHWKRFRGTLIATDGSSSGGELSGSPAGGQPGLPMGFAPPASFGPPMGFRGMPPTGFGPPVGGPGGGRQGDDEGSGFAPPGGFGGVPGGNVSEAQATSGLVELTLYGIVTLYEKYDANPTAAGTTADGAPPAAAPPAAVPPG